MDKLSTGRSFINSLWITKAVLSMYLATFYRLTKYNGVFNEEGAADMEHLITAADATEAALDAALTPIMEQIQDRINSGKFMLYVTYNECPHQVENKLIELGYKVEMGASGTGYYIAW